MHIKPFARLVLSLTLLILILTQTALAVGADLLGQEMDLAEEGVPWEVNLDSQGILWISHTYPSQIWRVDPSVDEVTIYPVEGVPSDARGDSAGHLWWPDLYSNRLSRLSTANNQVTTWEIPGSAGLYTTSIDGTGKIWVTDFSVSWVYRLDPLTSQVCRYALLDGGLANYIDVNGQDLWLGDSSNARLVRLDTLSGTYTWWQLPDESFPFDVELDVLGQLWWTDRDFIGVLDPVSNSFATFPLPPEQYPQVLSPRYGMVWYSFQGGYGVMNPAVAGGSVDIADRFSQTVSPDCSQVAPTSAGQVTPEKKTISWQSQGYQMVFDQDGWLSYASPPDGSPFGMVAGETNLWLIDQSRAKLAKLPYIQISACKLADRDGTLDTTADQSPVVGWPVYLRIDGLRQTPGKLTGPDGCAYWDDLSDQYSYGVEEDVPEPWVALTETSHDFGALQVGQIYSHYFVNHQEGSSIYLPLILR
jgi:streptogramin lyase